jgi:hypothetical protein
MVLCFVPSRLLSFIPRALQFLRERSTPDHVTVEAGSRPCSAAWPTCGSSSWQVHSQYMRKLRDLPSHGRPVTIRVAARRFRCLNAACTRKTFAERLDDAVVYARRTKPKDVDCTSRQVHTFVMYPIRPYTGSRLTSMASL